VQIIDYITSYHIVYIASSTVTLWVPVISLQSKRSKSWQVCSYY